MRLNALSTLSLLLPLALSNPTLEASHANPLQLRSPINTVPAAPSPTSPYFMLTGFEAFVSSPAYPTMHSRAVFTLTLVHPVLAQGWSTLCKITTASDLCDTDDFFPCQPVKGEENVDERLSFRFSTDVGSVEIMRSWTYNEYVLLSACWKCSEVTWG
ncbi:hypothetical protein M3J09_003886 [Ascochyta lentis]